MIPFPPAPPCPSPTLPCQRLHLKEKTVLLQKKDSEGFGFGAPGAKATVRPCAWVEPIPLGLSTPSPPTPAPPHLQRRPHRGVTPYPSLPALQYLESVEEVVLAWRAGMRMGDFLIEVNGQNVVKVGHRQVVNMIRQGGNTLMVKVVMVTRHPDMDEAVHKKAPQQAKRLPPPTISLRSKSMTSELEEMVSPWKKKSEYEQQPAPVPSMEKKRTVYQMALNKLDEILAAAQQTISASESPGPGGLASLGKHRPKGFFATESSFDPHHRSQPSYERPSYLPPGPGLMLRQKSIGMSPARVGVRDAVEERREWQRLIGATERQPSLGSSGSSSAFTSFLPPRPLVHPLTGKALDPASPLGLALAARERALKESSEGGGTPQPPPRPPSPRYEAPPPTPHHHSPHAHHEPVLRLWGAPPPDPARRELGYRAGLGSQEKSLPASPPAARRSLLHRLPPTAPGVGPLLLQLGPEPPAPHPGVSKAWRSGAPEEPERLPLHVRFLENCQPRAGGASGRAPPSEDGPGVPPPSPRRSVPTSPTSPRGSEENGLPLLVLPPPAPSVDVEDGEFLFVEPLPPPLEFSNSFEKPESPLTPGPPHPLPDPPTPATPLPPVPPPAVAAAPPTLDSTASSLTSYDSEVATLTQGALRLRRPASTWPTSPSRPGSPRPHSLSRPPPGTDSGIEEVDSRSSSDHPLETISSASTLSSLSAEGGGSAGGGGGVGGGAGVASGPELLDTYVAYLDVKASIISELSSKLQQFGGSSAAGGALPWARGGSGGSGDSHHGGASYVPERTSSLQRQRLSEDSQSSLLSKPVSSLFQNWPKPPLPPLPTGTGVPPSAAAAPGATSPSASSSSSTSTRHLQGVEFEMRPPLLRRAPSPSLLPASEHKVSPAPRPSSLPILPSGPLYPGLFDIRGSPTGGAGGSADPFAPVFVPPHPGMSGGLGGALSGASRSLSPTRLLSLPPDKPFGAKPLGFWTKFDVADWLEWLGLSEHRARFLDHEIDGSHLPALTKEDYVDLGVTRVGHRMNIDRALKFFLER
ncbi:SH3 and multiple ankyrin repeat domains protein 1 [Camelus dromedarius]|uniref:SH3 and multiple ankyrin repeat domains protein 1 n=1 Tax=Camelus dromedarius TaxID=9838 RepID=A0A5N4DTU0_CAMDR|nr:SH3 and multiple ankyrin repeat domains protein 1 [Camelus dromedarius]